MMEREGGHAPNATMLLIQELYPLIPWDLDADLAGKNTRLWLVLTLAGRLEQRFDLLDGAKSTANRAVRLTHQAGVAMFFDGLSMTGDFAAWGITGRTWIRD